MTMRGALRRTIAAFHRDRRGASAVEFAMIAPTVSLLLFASMTFFLLLRADYRAEAATFTVADIMSRQTTVSTSFLDTTYRMFKEMVTANDADVNFRISSVVRTAQGRKVEWSYFRSPMTALTDGEASALDLPLSAVGDSLVVVESTVAFVPATLFGGAVPGKHAFLSANRPRFTSAIKKTD